MNLKALLIHLFKEETPDEEERADAPQNSKVALSQDSRYAKDSEQAGTNVDSATQSGGGAAPEDDGDPGHDDDQEYDASSDVDVDEQPDASQRGRCRILSRILLSVFPSPNNEEEIQAYLPHYRVLPILSGIIIPFCILLDIPGLTADWYIRTNGSTIVASKHNPPILDVSVALSLVCAILANMCLVVRFLERRIKTMTILCTVFLSIHDVINVTILIAFGVTRDGYTFSEAFWLTLCSTIVSMFTNVTLITDLILTPDFKRSGSGLTRKQRSLVIIVIGLFCYIALGGLVNSLLLNLSFINGLYFTVVTIETIGFGDIVPKGPGSRVFTCFYAPLGIINLAFVVGYVRETVLEGLDFGYRRRLLAIQERRRAARLRKRAEKRWRHAIIWRLRERHERVWIPMNADNHRSFWSMLRYCFSRAKWEVMSVAKLSTRKCHRKHGMRLNLYALPPCQLEAAALEAGSPLDTLLPADFYDTYDQEACLHAVSIEHRHALPSWFAVHPVYRRGERVGEPLTHRRLGAMAAIVTRLGLAIFESYGNSLQNVSDSPDTSAAGVPEAAHDSAASLQTNSNDGDYRQDVEDSEQKAYYTRSGLSWGWFLIFWMGGAAIFKATEGWTYGTSVYFCLIAFSTIGYGDLAPTTPAGRAIFVVWALVGVATMTIFISVVSEAYSSRYKSLLGRNSFRHLIRKYHQRNKVELSEKVQRISSATGVELVLHDTSEHDVVESESLPAPSTTPAVASSSQHHPHVQQTQQSLERLPRQILTETRTIQQYVQLISGFDPHSAATVRFANEKVRNLIDEVMVGKKLPEGTKNDILNDSESRQSLMLLGIERSLKELVDISDQAIAAIQQRDQIIATLEREVGQDREAVTSR